MSELQIYELIGLIGGLNVPTWLFLLFLTKRINNVNDCSMKVKTALKMKFPDLKEILK